MSPEDRTRFVQIVGQVLIADGVLGDAEREHLDKVMDELNLTEDQRKLALKGIDMDSPVEERVAALSTEARGKLLEAVQKAVAADGAESKSETLLLERIRALVG